MIASATVPGIRLSTPLKELPGIGPKRALQLSRIGLNTVSDLIRHLPMRYEREFSEGMISDLPMDGIGSARGTLVATRWVGPPGPAFRGAKGRYEATLQDHSDRLYLVWFNAGYLRNQLKPGMAIRVQGKVRAFGGYPQMVNPKWEPIVLAPTAPPGAPGMAAASLGAAAGRALSTRDRLKPIYPSTEGLTTDILEKLMAQVLPQVGPLLPDPLPAQYVKSRAMVSLADAFRMIHQPKDDEECGAARRRLAFNELLLLQLGIAIKRQYNDTMLEAPALRVTPAIDEHIRARFPFRLTPSQNNVVREIAQDLTRQRPMNRLLQGDVGSGKTVVALYALLLAVADRKQAAIMAPTELLAEQHYQSIGAMLQGSNVRTALLTGSLRPAERASLLKAIEAGEIDLIVGTHALLTEKVKFRDLAVVVVDEQHRFGVMQRAALRRRALGGASRESGASLEGGASDSPPFQGGAGGGSGHTASTQGPEGAKAQVFSESDHVETLDARPSPNPSLRGRGARRGHASRGTHSPQTTEKTPSPHCLVMTATPIPRTLSLTVFGDLDVSTIHGLPPGRTPIITRVVTPEKADDVYRYMVERLSRGEQAYVVVPIIDAGGHESSAQLKNVRAHAKLLADKFCRGYEVASIHGQLKRDTRERIMTEFRAGKVHVLVATTVIEVGVDVPNATMMIVEHAERFGLSQLHQLRGRVGRGSGGKKSLCVFIAEPSTEDAARRMEAIAATTDGFKIAEADLEIRGTGELFGTRQHGAMPLKVARIPADMELLQMARRDAAAIVAEDPTLSDASRGLLRKVLVREYGDTLGLIDVG